MKLPRKSAIVVVAGVVCASAFGVGVASAGPGEDARTAASSPKSGKYKGKVGTFSRIGFNVKSGKKIKKLGAGVNAACQDTFGTINRFQEVAVVKQKAKIKKNGKIKGKGEDSNGTSWEIKGKFTSKKKAKGTFQASSFVFNPFNFTSELCSGSENWKAKLK
ncbi:MAG: hypothetical protein ACR2N5_04355 [Solirubrobacterales bacterium]